MKLQLMLVLVLVGCGSNSRLKGSQAPRVNNSLDLPGSSECQPDYNDPVSLTDYKLACPQDVTIRHWEGLLDGPPDSSRKVACLIAGQPSVLWVETNETCIRLGRTALVTRKQ